MNAFSGKTLIPIEASMEVSGIIPLQVKLVTYRILQEALNNIAKHAQAQHVWLHLQGNPGCVSLIIQDDGVGFPEGATEDGVRSFGLQIIDTLTKQLDGELSITRDPGTTFTLRFPYSKP
jgi:signal transduction histidine kinase